MKIVFTGGGGGGHFYPAIAVVEQVKKVLAEKKIIASELIFMWPKNESPELLKELGVAYVHNMAGKIRLYPSVRNIVDMIKTPFAILQAIFNLFKIYPDVVFSKGGYGAFPVVFAARILMIPVVVHESDTYPGRSNKWAGKFAKRVAVSYPEAAKHFNLEKVAYTGQPIRESLLTPATEPAFPVSIEENIPTILVLGGSQGAQIINDVVMESLIQLLPEYQVVHQTGKNNLIAVKTLSKYLLKDNQYENRYTPIAFLDQQTLSYLGHNSQIVITRAGSTLFEIAIWGIPAIVIPITKTNGDHQRTNAYSYARKGAASVIEEKNLTDNILVSEIRRILSNKNIYDSMSTATKELKNTNGARIIAEELVNLAQSH